MAAITPTQVLRESLGSATLLIATITPTTASDTWTIDVGDPVVAFWGQSNSGSGRQEPDITWAPTTGVFTFTSGTTVSGQFIMFIMTRT